MRKKPTRRAEKVKAMELMIRSMEKQKEQNEKGPLQRSFLNAGIRALEGEGNDHKYELSFSSEEPYERWFGPEILSHDSGALNLERLNSIGVLLFNHNSNRPIGAVEKAWVENGRGKAIVRFDTDDDAENIRKKVESGTLKGVSVGYVVDNFEEVKAGKTSINGKFTGPCWVAMKWTPLEISIVSVPADPTVGVGRSANFPDHKPGEGTEPEKKGVSSFYFMEKQLQINSNLLLLKGGKA